MNDETLYAAALEITDPTERDAFLRRECEGQPELRAEVDQLLQAHEQSNRLLDSPTGAAQFDIDTERTSALQVRCPHCHTPVELEHQTQLESIRCSSCESNFSLVSDSKAVTSITNGTLVGHFQLIERVGMGAFGAVWKAYDTKLDRTVAVKIPRTGQFDPEQEKAFLREAQNAAQLNHPGIVPVYEVGRDSDTLYIVSDFVDGLTLADWLTDQQPTVREATTLTSKIAAALHHAHERNVVHRDLKPGNIMLNLDLEPHLMDFGLARREVSDVTVSIDGNILGTPAYMSPEQAQGNGNQADRRSDIYSLGVVLFQLLTGELPFRGNLRMLLHQVINEEPPSPRDLNANLTRDLETITLKCLEKDPNRRYASAGEVKQELDRVLRNEPIVARPVSNFERGFRWVNRHRIISLLAASVVLSLAIGVVVSSYYAIQAQRQSKLALEGEKAAETATQAAVSEQKKTLLAQERAEDVAYASRMGSIQQLWETGDTRRAVSLLNEYGPNSRLKELRGFEWYYWKKAFWGTSVLLSQEDSKLTHAVACARKNIVATATTAGVIKVWDFDVGQIKYTLQIDGEAGVGSMAISPQGKFLAACSRRVNGVFLWDLESGSKMEFLGDLKVDAWSVAWSHDDKFLASGHKDGTISIWNIRKKSIHKRLIGHDGAVQNIAFSPINNSRLISSSNQWPNQGFKVWDLDKEQPLFEKNGGKLSSNRSMAFSPDGQIIALGQGAGEIILLDANSFAIMRVFQGHENRINDLCFSWDGQQLISCSIDLTVRVWQVADGKQLQSFRGHEGNIRAVCLLANNQVIVSAGDDRTVRMFNREQGATSVVQGEINGASSIAFSPNGNRIALGVAGGTSIWDINEQRRIKYYEGWNGQVDHGHVQALAFSPDEKTIAFGGPAGTVRVCSLENDEIIFSNTEIATSITSLAFTPDGEHLFAASGAYTGRTTRSNSPPHGDSVRIWDTSNWELVATLNRKLISHSALHPNGETVAISYQNGGIELWDWRAGDNLSQPLVKLSGMVARRLQFSPDGNTLAAGCKQGVIALIDVRKCAVRSLVEGHFSDVYGIAYAPDGKTLVSIGGNDMTLKMWKCSTEDEIYLHKGFEGRVTDVTFSHDGGYLAASSHDGKIRVWDGRPEVQQSWKEWFAPLHAAHKVRQLFSEHKSFVKMLDYLKQDRSLHQKIRKASLDYAMSIQGFDPAAVPAGQQTVLASLLRSIPLPIRNSRLNSSLYAYKEAMKKLGSSDVLQGINFDVDYYDFDLATKAPPDLAKILGTKEALASEAWDQMRRIWVKKAPPASVPQTGFVAIAKADLGVPAGTYRICVVSDDGVRVIVDGKTAVDNWSFQATETRFCDIELTAGHHEIRVEYFQGKGAAILELMLWSISIDSAK